MAAWAGADRRSNISPAPLFSTQSPQINKKGLDFVRASAWSIMSTIWTVETLTHAHRIRNPDGVSYLDIASACIKGHWGALVNAYWSPAYPFLLAVWLSIFRPSPYWEAFAVRCLNCLCVAAALLCFEYLLNGLIDLTGREAGALPSSTWKILGYALFGWIVAGQNPPAVLADSPDILVVAVVLLAGGILLRIEAGQNGWSRFAVLGVVLGVGYLIKAAMFPLALIFLGAAWLAMSRSKTPKIRLLASIALFVLVASPFVLALSKSKQHFTFGESGAINYAEFVNGARHGNHWQGQPDGTGIPLHPTRIIMGGPDMYEYAEPIGGSYPPWTDPSYWYAGIRPHFEIGRQIAALYRSATYLFQTFRLLSPLAAGFLALWLLSDKKTYTERLRYKSYLWIPAILGLGMYACVLIQPRYIAPFILLIWAAAFSALRLRPSESTRAALRCVTIIVCISLGAQIVETLAMNIYEVSADRVAPEWRVATALAGKGISPGDKVAFVGRAIDDHYWAHLAQVTIVSEVSEDGVEGFWTSSPEARRKAVQALMTTGAEAVVTRRVPPLIQPEGWQRVSSTDYYILQAR